MKTDLYLVKDGMAVSDHIRCANFQLGHTLVINIGKLHMILYQVPGDNRLAIRLDNFANGTLVCTRQPHWLGGCQLHLGKHRRSPTLKKRRKFRAKHRA